MGVRVAPTLNFRAVYNNSEYSNFSGEKEQGTRPNWIFGLSVAYRFPQISLETGLQWSNYDFQTLTTYNPPLRTGPSHTISPDWRLDKGQYNYIGLPLKINYFIGRGRIKGILGAGAALNYMYSQKSTFALNYYHAPFKRNIYPLLNVTPQFNVGVAYALNKKISLRLEPQFHFNFSFLREDGSNRKELLYGAGLMVSVHWNL